MRLISKQELKSKLIDFLLEHPNQAPRVEFRNLFFEPEEVIYYLELSHYLYTFKYRDLLIEKLNEGEITREELSLVIRKKLEIPSEEQEDGSLTLYINWDKIESFSISLSGYILNFNDLIEINLYPSSLVSLKELKKYMIHSESFSTLGTVEEVRLELTVDQSEYEEFKKLTKIEQIEYLKEHGELEIESCELEYDYDFKNIYTYNI